MAAEVIKEARIVDTNCVLVVLSKPEGVSSLSEEFCGTVFNIEDLSSSNKPDFCKKAVYLCGDLTKAHALGHELNAAARVFVIGELSCGHDAIQSAGWLVVGVGRVPVNVHGVGVLYRRFFDPSQDYFNKIRTEHVFQSLTESNKPGTAHREGIYLSDVSKEGDDLHFHLLRCSTNLSGPTENFRATDRHVVGALNQEASYIFEEQCPLNHVLAQIYWNRPAEEGKKQSKAKISAHADKTKDMNTNGIMAFCTFYDQLEKLHPMDDDHFDYGFRGLSGKTKTSGLTRLQFRLKKVVAERPGCTLAKEFSVTLYPFSAFFMPLSTNRLYTHEIKPAVLNVCDLPTRLGYVVRCSNRRAVHKDGHNYFFDGDKLIGMEPTTPEGMSELRRLYTEENRTDSYVDYGDKFLFSMNEGDYTKPTYNMSEEFRSYALPIEGNPFEELQKEVKFENVGKGRKGTVLVKPDEARGVPIVRTTTKYNAPAQCFQPEHIRLARQIQETASLPVGLNNALIENYDNSYATMGYHSDQELDLEGGTSVAVFACYKYPDLAEADPRKLIVESKDGGGTFEVPFTHNGIVVFSLDTNHRFKHKIVLEKKKGPQPPDNECLFITLRTSKTYVRYKNEQAYFEDGTPLVLADDAQRQEFYKLRGCENKGTDFTYPQLKYTISESDMVPPINFAEIVPIN